MFIALEKVYDRVLKEILWRVLEKKGGVIVYMQIIKDIYYKNHVLGLPGEILGLSNYNHIT